MSTNRKHQSIPHFNEHEVSLAMIKILEEQRISNEDLRTMDRDDVEHLFKNQDGFTFRDRKQFWSAIQKIRASPPAKTDVIYIEQDNEIPDVYDISDNQPATRAVPAPSIPQVSFNVSLGSEGIARSVEVARPVEIARTVEAPKSVEVSRSSFVEAGASVYELSSSEEESENVQIATTTLPIPTPGFQLSEPTNDIFVYPVQLPILSWQVVKALESNDISTEWSTLVSELAVWIYNKKQTTLSKNEFHAIGRTIFTLYPCIAKDGFRPWSHLCRCVTKRIRRTKYRHSEKFDVVN